MRCSLGGLLGFWQWRWPTGVFFFSCFVSFLWYLFYVSIAKAIILVWSSWCIFGSIWNSIFYLLSLPFLLNFGLALVLECMACHRYAWITIPARTTWYRWCLLIRGLLRCRLLCTKHIPLNEMECSTLTNTVRCDSSLGWH